MLLIFVLNRYQTFFTGNVKQALIELQLNLLKTIRDRIWQNDEKEGLQKLHDSLMKKDVKRDVSYLLFVVCHEIVEETEYML